MDTLVLDGNRLIAVDNAVKPKWFFEYEVETPERPRLRGTPELRHQPGEHAQSAALGPRFIAVRSVVTSTDSFERFVRFYDRQSLLECAYVTAGHKPLVGTYVEAEQSPLGRDSLVSNFQWHEVAFLNDTLLIAGGRDGLGLVETKGIKGRELRAPSQRQAPPTFLGEEQVRFFPPAPACEVVSVVPVPQLGGCYAIEAGRTGRAARWHQVA